MHPFDEAVRLEALPDGRWRGRTLESYWNMVSPFGGVTAAIALNGILLQSDRQGDPIALTVNYAAPMQQGDFEVGVRLTRANRSTQHWAVEIRQGANAEVMVNAIAVLAVRRDTWGFTEAVRPPAVSAAESRRFRPLTAMRWPAMYDVRYARGEVRTDSPDSLSYSWIQDAEPRAVDFLSLTAYCDTFAPRLFFRRSTFVPIGTVSLNIYFHVSADELARHGSEPIFGVAQGQVAHRGYFDQQAQLWGRQDRLLATTQQIVWYKE
ncbi:MAG: acyl-CoA thioesterase [Sulfurifustis sp.]